MSITKWPTITITIPNNNSSDMITLFGLNTFGSYSPAPGNIRVVEYAYAGGNTGHTMTIGRQYRIGTFIITSSSNFTSCCPSFYFQPYPIVWIGNDLSTTVIDTQGTGNNRYNSNVNCLCTSGINENNADLANFVYPNPAARYLTISLPQGLSKASIQIYNLIGEMKYSSDIIKENQVVDVSEFVNGVYIAVENTGNLLLRERFLINH